MRGKGPGREGCCTFGLVDGSLMTLHETAPRRERAGSQRQVLRAHVPGQPHQHLQAAGGCVCIHSMQENKPEGTHSRPNSSSTSWLRQASWAQIDGELHQRRAGLACGVSTRLLAATSCWEISLWGGPHAYLWPRASCSAVQARVCVKAGT